MVRNDKQTVVLVVLDGWGMAPEKMKGNAITPKTAPIFFSLYKDFPHTLLKSSGEDVGLFAGQEGNSEAGHLNIGAGRIVKQDALFISDSISDRTFFKNSAFLQAIHHVKKYRTSVHLMGLLSNINSAHSCPDHLYAMLDLFHQENIEKVYLHLFTDGRDSGQHDALSHLKKLEAHFHGNERIATVIGRYYAMDRNKVWARTEAAFEAMVSGIGKKAESASNAISMAYNSGESDEFISPTVITDNGKPVAKISNNDAVFFFNLRSDRARQLTKVFVQSDFTKNNPGSFKPKRRPKNIRFVAMTDFGPDLPQILTAFPSRDVKNSLVKVLCPLKQMYVAESEKFAHITYFLNGGYAEHFCDEKWVKIESDRIKEFEKRPAMKAKEIAETIIKGIESGDYDFIAANFANADMVGHTGNFEAAKIAVGTIDQALKGVFNAVKKHQAVLLITADHGNAEEMVNLKTGEIDSEHSAYPVPLVIASSQEGLKKRKIRMRLRPGRLGDVAPTILKIMGREKPAEMTGKALY